VVLCLTNSQTIPDEDWGYVNIRANANLFWWLYGSQNLSKRAQQPLVIWLQGGPGGSSCGFGNFQEIGPLDVNLQTRQYTWIQNANVMFIDSPVGTGFSYVTQTSAYCTTDDQIGVDIVSMLKPFLTKYPMFETLPLYIFCESYGGKEATSLAVALVNALNQKSIKVNFKGVSLGDSWISPIDFINTYGEYLYETSEIDSVGLQKVQASAKTVDNAVSSQNWATATQLWASNQGVIESVSDGVDVYNILNRSPNRLSDKTGLERAFERISSK
jgi:serine carboxypeptidase 1